MQYLLLLLSLGAIVRSSFIPTCASTCVGEAIDASSCSSADTACICSSREFLPELRSCIETNCEDEDQQDAIAHTDQFCALVQPKQVLRARNAAPEPEAEIAAEQADLDARDAAPEAEAEADAEAWGPAQHQGQGYGRDKQPSRQGWWDWAKQRGNGWRKGWPGKEQKKPKQPGKGPKHHQKGKDHGKGKHPEKGKDHDKGKHPQQGKDHGEGRKPSGGKHNPPGYDGNKHNQPKHKKPHKPKTHSKKPHKPTKTHKTHKPHKPTTSPKPAKPHHPTTFKTTTSCKTTKSTQTYQQKPHTPTHYPQTTRSHTTHKPHTTHPTSYSRYTPTVIATVY